MKLFLTKRQDGSFLPSYPSDHDKVKKIKVNDEVEVTIRKARNPMFHRKFFALINMTFENQEKFTDINALRYWLTMKAGFYDKVETPDEKLMFLPKSISFEKMDEHEFSDLYDRILDVISNFLNVSKPEIEREIVNFY